VWEIIFTPAAHQHIISYAFQEDRRLNRTFDKPYNPAYRAIEPTHRLDAD